MDVSREIGSDRLAAIDIVRILPEDRKIAWFFEFRNAEVEAAYRIDALGSDRTLARIGIVITVLLNLAFFFADIALIDQDAAVSQLAAIRGGVALLGVATLYATWQCTARGYDLWITAFTFALTGLLLIVDAGRPLDYVVHFIVDGLLLTGIFVVFVTRFRLQVILGTIFCAGLIWIAHTKSIPLTGMAAISVSMTCSLLIGGLLCGRLHFQGRRRFATMISEQEMRTTLETLAFTDALTGLSNRRDFIVRSHGEFERFRRHRDVFSLILLDLDHFKQVNDEHGHEVGDELLACFGGVLKEAARASDLASRLGGEEFAVLLPNTDLPAAEVVAARILEATRAERSRAAPDARITVSAGITQVRVADRGIDDLMSRADRALYAAKERGRDRAVSAMA